MLLLAMGGECTFLESKCCDIAVSGTLAAVTRGDCPIKLDMAQIRDECERRTAGRDKEPVGIDPAKR